MIPMKRDGEGFQEFKGRSLPVNRSVPRFAIQRSGLISLNGAAFKLLGEPEFVVFLYDAERKAIGLKPASQGIAYAYPVRRHGVYHSYRVSARAFLRHFGIKYGSEVLSFHPYMEGDVLVVKLDEDGNEIEGT